VTTFEDLGLAPELVEALSAEGIERPTALQADALPLVRRASNAVLAAGPGSGTLIAYAAGLLDRLDAEGSTPRALVLTPTSEVAGALADSVARLAATTGHTVAALGSPWALPERAQFLFATPTRVLEATARGALSLADVQALVLDQAGQILELEGTEPLKRVLDFVPAQAQRVALSLPVTPAVEDFASRHMRRAVRVPAPLSEEAAALVPHRGTVRYRVAPEPKEDAALAVVDEMLSGDARHVLLFAANDDRAADLGDYLTLHGFVAGAPGDEALPVWLGVDALEAREAAAAREAVAAVSFDVPPDADTLDRRHGFSDGGVILIRPMELAHLRDAARRAGYRLSPTAATVAPSMAALETLRRSLSEAIETLDIAPYMLVLEPLFDRFDPAEIAAAATALFRQKAPAPPPTEAPRPGQSGAPTPWVRLFVGVGHKDDLRPGDLLGAITGEAGVEGSHVGRIDIRENFTLVDVAEPVARKVIRALNGTTIRGRSVRADFDRGARKASHRGGPRSSRAESGRATPRRK